MDAFGHSAGLPKILHETGFTHYVCSRAHEVPPLFRWKADDGSQVTVLKILISYGTGGVNREWFNQFLEAHINSELEHQTLFFGVGDHDGGISRTQLGWLREAQEKYDIVFSTLSEYFQAVKDCNLPEVTGELGPVFRGCYSNCHEVKRKIARAVRRLLTAEKLGVPASELQDPWRELLFNHFHDILPGTSIREAYERDVFPGLGGVESAADRLIDRELHRRSAGLNTHFMDQGGFFCWNPHPERHRSIISHIGFADPNMTGRLFNAIRDENGTEYPLQLLPAASSFGPCGSAWGRLTAVVDLPPLGGRTLAYACTEKNYPPLGFEKQKELLKKIAFEVFFDDTHTWGFGLVKFASLEGQAKLTETIEYQNGPVCSILRSVWKYRNSEITLDLIRYAGIAEIGVRIRLDWHEVKCALKIVFRHGLTWPGFFTGSSAAEICRIAEGEVSTRFEWNRGVFSPHYPESGEVSVIDWCAAVAGPKIFAVFAPDLHSCDHAENSLRITLARPVLYSDHSPFKPDPYYGWMDQGVSWRDLWIAEPANSSPEQLPALAAARLHNGESCEITAHDAAPGIPVFRDLPSDMDLGPVIMEAYRLNESGEYEIHLRNPAGKTAEIRLPAPAGKTTIPPHSLRIIAWPGPR